MNLKPLSVLLALAPFLASVAEAAPGDRRGTRSYGPVVQKVLPLGASRYEARPRGIRVRSGRVPERCATPVRPVYSPRSVWIPGRYEIRERRVWVDGGFDRVWVEPEFGLRLDDCGLEVRFLLRRGYWKNGRRPGHYELRREKVWVPGHWRRR